MKAREDGMLKARIVSMVEVSIVEHVVGDGVDGVGLGALGDADGQHVLVDVQDVAALDVEGVVATRSRSACRRTSGWYLKM